MRALPLLLLFNFAYRIYADCPNGTFPNASGGKCYFIPNDSEDFILAEMGIRTVVPRTCSATSIS